MKNGMKNDVKRKTNGMVTIFKKELARFFGDRRMVLTTLFLPGLLIYAIYNLMGGVIASQFMVEETYLPGVVVVEAPEALDQMLDGQLFFLETGDAARLEEYKQEIADEALDLCVVFPAGFDRQVAAYEPESGAPAPNVEVYYNSVSSQSETAYRMVLEGLNQYESSLANRFDVNRDASAGIPGAAVYDMATEQDMAGSFFSSLMPMLLLIFLFSGCMAVATESIAGEKERGTIATLLVTPVRREEIALGKILALAIIALLSGLFSTLGTVLSLPKLLGAASAGLSISYYAASDYLLLGVVILATVILLVALISLVSAWAKTIKEAQTLVLPLMILVMLVGISGMLGGGAPTAWYYYLIPLYNSVQCMVGILSFSAVPGYILLTACSNLVYSALGAYALSRMFRSERVMFSR